MMPSKRSVSLALGLVLFTAAFAPAGPAVQKDPKLESLARKRYGAALAQYDLAWTYYKESRVSPFFVGYWSKEALEAELDLSSRPSDRLAALEANVQRIEKLIALVKRVQKFGFQYSIDVKQSAYFEADAEFRLALEQAKTP